MSFSQLHVLNNSYIQELISLEPLLIFENKLHHDNQQRSGKAIVQNLNFDNLRHMGGLCIYGHKYCRFVIYAAKSTHMPTFNFVRQSKTELKLCG